jgi:predicted alpha/beta-hydrolase family hydrolase
MPESVDIVTLRFQATPGAGAVSAILMRPRDATSVLVLGHGAGAGMCHPFMESVATMLAEHGVATFRYQFPYMERGGRRPDHRPVLVATVRAAVAQAAELAADLPRFAGGKSLGGRMTSHAAAAEALPGVRGLVFLGFPLHPAGRPGTERADHLTDVTVPMLFLQGTRDKLADLALLEPVCAALGVRSRLHIVDGADHSFHVLKRSGRTDEQAVAELAATTAAWTGALSAG